MASFKKFNLQDSPGPLGKFDIVFLRYVTIYFSEEFKKDIFANLARVVPSSGHLVIGAVESLRGLSDDFERQTHAGGSYYKRA